MNLDETFQFLFPWLEEAHIIPRWLLFFFLQDLWPFVSFSHIANKNYYLCNSSYSVQEILMKLPRYCSHNLKVIISLRREAKLKMTQLVSLIVYPFNLNNLEITFFCKLFLTTFRKIKKLVCWKGCKISKHCLGHICYRHIHHILTFQTSGDTWPVAFYSIYRHFCFYKTWGPPLNHLFKN